MHSASPRVDLYSEPADSRGREGVLVSLPRRFLRSSAPLRAELHESGTLPEDARHSPAPLAPALLRKLEEVVAWTSPQQVALPRWLGDVLSQVQQRQKSCAVEEPRLSSAQRVLRRLLARSHGPYSGPRAERR